MASVLDQIPPPHYDLLVPSETSSPISARSSASSALKGTQSTGSSVYNSSIDSEDGTNLDELEESLPAYTPALTMKGLLQMKPELSSPFCRATHRNWRTAALELNNTQLQITQSDVYGLDLFKKTTTFSLQFAEIGLASDYTKRPYCFRIRFEGKQAVFDCRNRQEMLGWMVSLQMAISLALPLELRQMPEEIRRRRRHHRRGRERSRAHNTGESRHERELITTPVLPGNTHETIGPPAHREPRLSEGTTQRSSDRRNSRGSNRLPRASIETGEVDTTQPDQDLDSCSKKWHPRRRESRFSEKDYPHLFMDTSWEGKNILYRGRWAKVRNQQIILLLAGSFASSYLTTPE